MIAEKNLMHDIDEMDFSMVKRKLTDPEEGLAWNSQKCDQVEKDYKRFLFLKRTYPDIDIVPNKLVDSFWHYHILDTQKYAEDCELLFGYFVHHYPYFGMNGDEKDLEDAFQKTSELYEYHFGEILDDSPSKCKRTACKPQKCR